MAKIKRVNGKLKKVNWAKVKPVFKVDKLAFRPSDAYIIVNESQRLQDVADFNLLAKSVERFNFKVGNWSVRLHSRQQQSGVYRPRQTDVDHDVQFDIILDTKKKKYSKDFNKLFCYHLGAKRLEISLFDPRRRDYPFGVHQNIPVFEGRIRIMAMHNSMGANNNMIVHVEGKILQEAELQFVPTVLQVHTSREPINLHCIDITYEWNNRLSAPKFGATISSWDFSQLRHRLGYSTVVRTLATNPPSRVTERTQNFTFIWNYAPGKSLFGGFESTERDWQIRPSLTWADEQVHLAGEVKFGTHRNTETQPRPTHQDWQIYQNGTSEPVVRSGINNQTFSNYLNAIPHEEMRRIVDDMRRNMNVLMSDELLTTSESSAIASRELYESILPIPIRESRYVPRGGARFVLREPGEMEQTPDRTSSIPIFTRENYIPLTRAGIMSRESFLNEAIGEQFWDDVNAAMLMGVGLTKKREFSVEVIDKSKQFLLSVLTEQQKQTFQYDCFIDVVGSDSQKIYRIVTGNHQMNIYEMNLQGQSVFNLCAHIDESKTFRARPGESKDGAIPLYDHIAAQVLTLKLNEGHFLQTANIWASAPDAHLEARRSAKRQRN